MTIPLLILRLHAPYQAWGYGSRWDYRKTNSEPTKSGIVGLLSCALGYPVFDQRIEELSKQITVSIRVEHEGYISTDYHTILGPHLKSDGSYRNATVESWRYYLEDAIFLILISGSKPLLETLRNAISKPVWPYYLGRKCCIPSKPILLELTEAFSSVMEAIEKYPYAEETIKLRKNERKKASQKIRYIIEDPNGQKSQLDEIKPNKGRFYEPRYFTEGFIDAPKELLIEPSEESEPITPTLAESDRELKTQDPTYQQDSDRFYGWDEIDHPSQDPYQNSSEEN